MLNFFVVLICSNFLRKRYDFAAAFPKLNLYLKFLWVFALLLFPFKTIAEEMGLSIIPLWYAMFGFLLYCYWLFKENQKVDPIMISAIAFIIISFITDTTKAYFPAFYDENSGYLNSGVLGAFISMIAFAIGFSNQQKALKKEQEKSELISKRKDELEYLVLERTTEILKQKEEIVLALEELKSTQSQLIHSEKMASLGELTAGIAHEIQNPLNFVNNFSEVTEELIEELEIEDLKLEEERDKELQKELLDNIKQNLRKINHHGQRASNIVNSMLAHSRSNSGEILMTDINALADEYLRLSYHGIRAKDKNFNANYQCILDEKVPKINTKAQDIGRVILNLINNAFYAVNERKALEPAGYKPEVIVYTRDNKETVEIEVKDNGVGIEESSISKIFQPFYTSKPSGQGTGLGLSLSYEIITQGHGGTIEVKSVQGQGSSFIMNIPKNLKP